jgi:hypothetical protein
VLLVLVPGQARHRKLGSRMLFLAHEQVPDVLEVALAVRVKASPVPKQPQVAVPFFKAVAALETY